MCISTANSMKFNILKYSLHHTKEELRQVKASSIKNEYWHLRKAQDNISSFIFVGSLPSNKHASDTKDTTSRH